MENFFTIVITSGIAGAIASSVITLFTYHAQKKTIRLIKLDI